eukprot:1793071-Pyramimonas_sp.AAC.2
MLAGVDYIRMGTITPVLTNSPPVLTNSPPVLTNSPPAGGDAEPAVHLWRHAGGRGLHPDGGGDPSPHPRRAGPPRHAPPGDRPTGGGGRGRRGVLLHPGPAPGDTPFNT